METVKGGSSTKVAFALLIAIVVSVAGIIAYSYHSPSTANSATSSGNTASGTGPATTASSSSEQYAYSVVKANVSVPASVAGGVPCFWDLPCAIPATDPICCVTLISYQGGYYYLDQVDFQGRVYDAWLTNSTVYCTSPVSDSFPECPTGDTTETTTTRTCTAIPNLSYTYCGGSLRISAVGQANGSGWNYTVTISSDDVAQGQTVQLVANLTNLGQNVTFGDWVAPYINPSVNTMNGTQVWAWDPSQVQFPNVVVTAGETISQVVVISTSRLLPGQSYLIDAAPISIQLPTPNDLTFTFQLSVE